jgi:transposase
MPSRTGPAHVVTTTRTYKGKVYRTHLLRRSFREDGKVKNETLGNLSHLPDPLIEIIRRSLQGERFVPVGEAFEIISSRPQGHVQAVRMAMKRLEMASLLGSRPSRERDLVLAMIASRIVAPSSKLSTTRAWHTTTLAADFGVTEADEDDLYAAMDWLLARQESIQKKLAARHLETGGQVLYDLSSSYFEGTHCPLARLGYNRDGKKGLLQVNYGLMTDRRGCPVAVTVHEGNVSDSKTFLPEVERLRQEFGIEEVVLVGDRGMIGKATIEDLRKMPGIGWITGLKSASIRALVEEGQVQMDLFDDRNLVEIVSPMYPGERLMACRNSSLAWVRAKKREALLVATEEKLRGIQAGVEAGRRKGAEAIGLAVGKVINHYKVGKHFELDIGERHFTFTRKTRAIEAEAALDGIYIIRTNVATERMEAAECVRNYKALSQVERAFRTFKTTDLKVRPIYHRVPDRVRAHLLLCMLAYYVEWHLREAWRELMFADTDLSAKATRDPVAPAQRSKAAMTKISRRKLDDGSPVHSFSTLMAELSTLVRNTCRVPGATGAPDFEVLTTPSPTQRRALDLIDLIRV